MADAPPSRGNRQAGQDRLTSGRKTIVSTLNSLKNSSLEGKVAIVTGSTQGLGEGVAHLFAERGIAGLVITGRNAERGAR